MTKQRPVKKYVVLLMCVLTSFLNPFTGASINIALPQISKEFSLQAVSMGWVSMAFLLSSAIFLLPMGKLADIKGRKRIFLSGNIIFTVSALLSALSQSGTMLIIFRAMMGIGAAMFFGTSMAILTSVFPANERGKVLGINVSAVYLGLSLAPVLGGFLTHVMGWRSLFWVVVPISAAVILGSYIVLRGIDWAESKDDKLDIKGSLIYMLAISSLMYGFSKLPDIQAIAFTVMGVIGLLIFVWVELKTSSPVLNMRLFSTNRVFAFSNLAALINYAATYAVSFILSLYLQYVKGYTPQHTGLLLVAQPVFMMLVSTVSGRMSDKYDSRILASAGMGLITIGLLMLIPITFNTANSYIIICLIVLGIGFGLFSSPNTNSVMSSVEKKYLGVASATIGTMRLTGQMMSMGISTLIIHVFIGEAKLSYNNSALFLQSSHIMFLVFSILCLAGIFASLARGKKVKKA
jgi:EmrB/QacA subfamily drug resistance transporter